MSSSNPLDETLLNQKHQAEEKDAERRAEKLGYSYLNLVSVKVPTELKAMALVPEERARKAFLVPLQMVRKKLIVAVYNPENKDTVAIIKELKEKGFEVHVVIVSLNGLNHIWTYYKYVISIEVKDISGKIDINGARLREIGSQVKCLEDLENLIKNFKSSYTSEILEVILGGALALHASDIHLEPSQGGIGVLRLRVDGLLHQAYKEFKPLAYRSMITRIKLLSSLKINMTSEPQDGRFTIGLEGYNVEIRTSVIPSEYGETLVLRILDPNALKVHLEDLGWRQDDLEIVRREITKPNGLILNTGPTGSGKTTTLYAFLRHVFRPEIKIITIEDPIEYHLAGISQTQVDQGASYTFASGLRSILRQDPDIVLVGEIRDQETAEIALNASLTGHLVLSTLHTNDAVGAIPRLLDLKVSSHTIGPSLSLVIAQRLIRVLCPTCKTKKALDENLKTRIQNFIKSLPSRVDRNNYQNFNIFEPKGCTECHNLGFKGRISIFELFVVDEEGESLIYSNPTEVDLKKYAIKQGMVTMQEDGVLKALLGITGFSEVERLTGQISWLR